MLTSAASGHTTKPEPPAAPSTVGAATRGSLSLPSRSSLVKGVPVSAEGDGTSMGSVSLQRLVERDALEPAPHHTAADRRVLEILRRARDCAADLESESQGPPVKRRASNRNRSPAVVHTNDNSSSREMVGVPSTSKSNVAVPATGVTATTADSGFNIRPKISHVAAATTTASVSSVQRATNGIPSGPAKSAAAALTISSPIKFQVLKNGASTPSQLPNTLSTSQPAVPTSLTNPLTATKVATWTPTAPIPTSLSAPTQVSPLLSSSGRPLHIGLELILSNGVRIPISATCGLKPENNTQRPVTGTTGLTLPTLTSEQVTVAAKTVTIPVESTLQPAASSPPKSPNSVSPVTKNSKQTLASAAAATIPRKSSPGAATAYYNGEGGVVEDEELSDDPEVSVSADSKADLEATAGDNRSRICSCLRSNCLKLYCDCFAAGRACEGCHCRHCRNNLSDDITRRARDFAMRMALARNPRAFKPKIETNSGTEGKHLLGCRCKRSHCLKNYCECYLAKISCSKLCRCLSCSNANKKAHSKAGSSPTSSSSCSRSASCSGYSAPSEHEKACHDSRESSTTGGVKVLSATSLPATASFRTTAVDVPAQSIQTLNFPASSVTDRPTSIQSLLLSSPLVSPELLKCLRGQHVVVAATPALKGTSAPAAQISLLPGLSTASRVISLSTTTASTTTQSSVAACLSGNQTATSSNGVGNSFAALGRLIINGTATNQGCSTGSGAGGNCILVQTTTCSVPPKPQQQQQQQPPPQPTASVYSEAAAAAAEVGCDEVPEPGTETVTVAAVDAPIDYSEYTEEELELMQSLLEENSVGNRVRPASIDAPSEHTPRARCCGLSPSQAVQNHLNKSVCPEVFINRALSSISPVDDSTDHMSIQLECNRTRPMSLPSMENSPESSPPASPRHHHPESYSLSAPASISSQPEWAIPRKVQSATSGNEDISVLVQKIRVLERRVAKLMHVVQAQGNALRDMSARENDPILHPAPGLSVRASQLTEDQQIKIAVRMGLIVTLPVLTFDESKREKLSECVICMCDYELGDELRYLPCMHTFHRACIDDWLMRSLTCPSCLEELKPPPIVTTPPPRTHETAGTTPMTTTATTTTTSSAPSSEIRSARRRRRSQNNGVGVSATGLLPTASPDERPADMGAHSTCSSSLTSTTSSTASSNNATYVVSEVSPAPTGSTSDPAYVPLTSPGTKAPGQRASRRRRRSRPHTSSAHTRSSDGGRGGRGEQ